MIDRDHLRQALLGEDHQSIAEAARSILAAPELYYCVTHSRSTILPFGSCSAASRDCDTRLRVMLDVVE